MTFNDFTNTIQFLCSKYGGSVTSWIRSAAHNKLVGGLTNSCHIDGYAVDIVLDDRSKMDDLVKEAQALKLDAVNEGSHIHVELDKRNRT